MLGVIIMIKRDRHYVVQNYIITAIHTRQDKVELVQKTSDKLKFSYKDKARGRKKKKKLYTLLHINHDIV